MSNPPPVLVPIYPLGAAGESILLYEGSMKVDAGLTEGAVELRLTPEPALIWRSSLAKVKDFGAEQASLEFDHPAGRVGFQGHLNGFADGWMNSVQLGSDSTPVHRLIVNWINLADVGSTGLILSADGQRKYTGRLQIEADGWLVKIDRRHDFKEVWELVRSQRAFAATHVMEVVRTDGSAFTPSDAKHVLDALHLGLSFAMGRWAAPMLPVGLDEHDNRIWEHWYIRQCTAGSPGTLRWWTRHLSNDLIHLLEILIKLFRDPQTQFSLRFLLSSGVAATSGAFLEQRISTAFSAIEHLLWQRLVIIGKMSKSAYRKDDFEAHQKLSMVLVQAGIVDSIDPDSLPSMYAIAQKRAKDLPKTAPAIACWVRNMIVHPTGHEDVLYGVGNNVVEEAWTVTHQYLVLLLLHHVGYMGSYRPMLKPGGWEYEVEPVPWAT